MPTRARYHCLLPLICPILLTSCLVFWTVTLKAQTTAPTAPWLPQDTIVAVRIPNGKAFVDALKQNTKLGTMLFGKERMEKLPELIADMDPDQWEAFTDDLTEYGLTTDNFLELLTGDSGFALLLRPDEDDAASPLPTMALVWLEPGKELARRVMDAVGQVAQDHADDPNPVNRVDREIHGQHVMQLSLPQISDEFEEVEFNWPDDFEEMAEQQQDEVMEKWEQRWEQGRKEVVTYSTALVTQAGDRLMMAYTLEGKSQTEEAVQLERLANIFARFIGPQDDEKGFIAHLEAMAGVQHALPQTGVVGLEVYGDLTELIRLGQSDSEGAWAIEGLGINQVGAAALRLTLDGEIMHMGMFLAAPEPRTGILGLLNQPNVATTPPAWVPSDLVSYRHFSFDVGKAYVHIKKMVLDKFGEQTGLGFQMAEGSAMQFAGADLTTILSSLGHQHILLGFDLDMLVLADSEAEALGMPAQRFSVVWQVKDNTIWTRLLQSIQDFASMTNGALTATDEQGFTGARFKKGPVEGGLFHGNGYLVLAFGEGVVQKTLSALSNPPKGKDALRTSKLYNQAATMIEPQRAMFFEIRDGKNYSQSMWKMIMSMFDVSKMDGDKNDDEGQVTIRRFLKLMPTEEELENILGISARYMFVDEKGLTMKSTSRFPAPN